MQNGSGPRKHTIAVLVENKFGVLSRVAGLFSARGYNIESLSVGETLDPAVSRITLEATGDEGKLEALVELLRPTGIQELVRTGKVAIARGSKTRVRKAEPARERRP